MPSLSEFFANNRLLSVAIVAVVCVILVAVVVAAYRLLFSGRLRMTSARTRQPRLGVVDAYDLDRQRQLVLVRRDNVEHLLMIGGPNDVVIETAIIRSGPIQVRENSAGGAQPTVAIPATGLAPLPDQPSAPTPMIASATTGRLNAPALSVGQPEPVAPSVLPSISSGPTPQPLAASERAPAQPSTSRPAPPQMTTPARPATPLPPRQPPASPPPAVRPMSTGTPLPPRQVPIPPLPRPVTTPTRPLGQGPAAPSTVARPAEQKTSETTEASANPATPAAKTFEPSRRTENAPAPREPLPAGAPVPLNGQAPRIEPQAKVGTGSSPRPIEPSSGAAKLPPAVAVPPRPAVQPPVRSLDALESLEEEMAKLLGRPVPPPDR